MYIIHVYVYLISFSQIKCKLSTCFIVSLHVGMKIMHKEIKRDNEISMRGNYILICESDNFKYKNDISVNKKDTVAPEISMDENSMQL